MKPVNADYNQDFCARLENQANLLINHEFEKLDLEHLTEELQAMAREERREVKWTMLVLIAHLLKWQYQPEKNTAGRRKCLFEQRRHLRFALEDSPGLKHDFLDAEWMQSVWTYAVERAALESGLAEHTFPKAPGIWTIEQILDDDFFPTEENE